MNSADTIAYFGFGSLVNLNTLTTPYIAAHRAKLDGWRRVWLPRPSTAPHILAGMPPLAFLSAEPSPGIIIDGMVVVDHAASLPALDLREVMYKRTPIGTGSLTALDENAGALQARSDLFLYVAEQEADPDSVEPRPSILRSYLDAVFQGFLHNFGDEALERFVFTTRNFHLPVLEDRDNPIYPRHVTLSRREKIRFDSIELR
ncbi:MAG: gamma-glutamylcyclotransferase family protein [Pseudomonadota bacterium]